MIPTQQQIDAEKQLLPGLGDMQAIRRIQAREQIKRRRGYVQRM